MNQVVDVRWPICRPGRVPLQHQYPLLAALSGIVPEIHRAGQFGIHPIRGHSIGPGQLELTPSSALTIRTEVHQLPQLLGLSGKKLNVAGCPIRLGIPQIAALAPCCRLASHLVTIKGYLEESPFAAALRRQLDSEGVSPSAEIEIGPRRVLRIKEQTIVGFSVKLSGLSEDESLRVQTTGLGGRRHFGCGLFLPAPVRSDKGEVVRP